MGSAQAVDFRSSTSAGASPSFSAISATRRKADQAAAAVYEARGEPSEEAQAALYEAAFRAFQGNDWFGGIAWFELNGDGEQPEADDFSFAGKQAEEVLRAWQTAS